MIKYVGTAWALKVLSLSGGFYRALGNTFGARSRVKSGLSQAYIDRAKVVHGHCQKYDVKDGGNLLELGTGWVHFESLIFKLFRDVNTVLFDVWDNRQLSSLKQYCADLDKVLDKELDLTPEESKQAHERINQVLAVETFDELYDLWNWKYVIDPSGKLSSLQDNSFDLVYSTNVAEHIQAEIVPNYIKDMYRVLKPGGLSIQSIDPKDHLSYYTSGVSPKYYLKYSDSAWKLLFENGVQYFNRIQASQWLKYFDDAGFELVEDFSVYIDVAPMDVHEQYSDLSENDINCSILNVVHKKPEA